MAAVATSSLQPPDSSGSDVSVAKSLSTAREGSKARNSLVKVRNAQQFINKIRNQMYEIKKVKEKKKPNTLGQNYMPNGIQVCTSV